MWVWASNSSTPGTWSRRTSFQGLRSSARSPTAVVSTPDSYHEASNAQADRLLDARRSPDSKSRGAGSAGRDRRLVRAPAGQALRRRLGLLGDGVELCGALPQ